MGNSSIEKKYTELAQKNNLIISVTNTGYWSYDPQKDYLDWDERMFTLYDVNPADFRNKFSDWSACCHPDDLEETQKSFYESIRTKGEFSYVFRVKHKDGSIKYIKAAATAILDHQGEVEKMIGINQDFTPFIEAERAAKRSAELYKSLISQSPIATAMLDTEMRYITASKKWMTDYGLDGKKVEGVSHYELFPEVSDEWKEIHRICLNGTGQSSQEDAFERADGTTQYLRWDIQPWYDTTGKVGGLIMFSEDITTIVEEEKLSRRLSNLLGQTQSISRIGSWEVNLETSMSFWDDITKEIHKVPRDYQPTLDNGIKFYKPGYSRDRIQEVVTRSINEQEPFDEELQIIDAEGTEVWVRAIGKPTVLNGQVAQISGVFQDIDKYKKQQIALELNNEMFEGAFNHSPNGMALVSTEGKWMRVNKKLCEMLEYPEEELLQTTFQEITHPDDLDKDITLLKSCLDGERNNYEIEKRYLTKSKQIIWVNLSVALIKGELENSKYFVSQINNITVQKKAIEEINLANQSLELMANRLSNQNKSLRNFAHITSHNLRAPVGNLIALNEIFEQAESSEERDLIYSKVKSETIKLSKTLDNLIDTLIIKEKEAKPELIDLPSLVENLCASMERRIEAAGFKVVCNFQEEQIFSDLTSFESIFLNLISNAIKYRRNIDNPHLIISNINDGEDITFTFEDNGLGINLERHKSKVFGLNKTFHRNPDAKGVGLFMVKAHVESLGGKINIKSTPNHGSIFSLQFSTQTIIRKAR